MTSKIDKRNAKKGEGIIGFCPYQGEIANILVSYNLTPMPLVKIAALFNKNQEQYITPDFGDEVMQIMVEYGYFKRYERNGDMCVFEVNLPSLIRAKQEWNIRSSYCRKISQRRTMWAKLKRYLVNVAIFLTTASISAFITAITVRLIRSMQ